MKTKIERKVYEIMKLYADKGLICTSELAKEYGEITEIKIRVIKNKKPCRRKTTSKRIRR